MESLEKNIEYVGETKRVEHKNSKFKITLYTSNVLKDHLYKFLKGLIQVR